MGYEKRLNSDFTDVPTLPMTHYTKYVFFSDCHRGVGNNNDNFLKNQNNYFAALSHYYKNGYVYIEVGDGDELWENRDYKNIIDIHNNIFWLLSLFYRENRLFMLYGNHDMVKKNNKYVEKNCCKYFCSVSQEFDSLFQNMKYYSGLIIKSNASEITLNVTHGHQADTWNSVFWKLSRFLVRYLWSSLEYRGVLDPTSAAKNNTRKNKTEKKLINYATHKGLFLLTGHTHKPTLGAQNPHYFNCGSCVHPRCITCIELTGFNIRLVKWHSGINPLNNTAYSYPQYPVYIKREILADSNLLNIKNIPAK